MKERTLEPELMDDPSLDDGKHRKALNGLARLNRLCDASGILWRPLIRFAKSKKLQRLRILDIATGSGDVPLGLARRAKRAGLEVELTGIDVSPVAIEQANERARMLNMSAAFLQRDLFAPATLDELKEQQHDVVVCSLFLHHLDAVQGKYLILLMNRVAKQLAILSDLRRERLGLWLTYLAVYGTTRSPVVHQDGPASVRAAFTAGELEQLLEKAEVKQRSLQKRWPFRMCVTWEPLESESIDGLPTL